MKTVIQIIFTILVLICEVVGSIICFRNLYEHPLESIFFWAIGTICAVVFWMTLVISSGEIMD